MSVIMCSQTVIGLLKNPLYGRRILDRITAHHGINGQSGHLILTLDTQGSIPQEVLEEHLWVFEVGERGSRMFRAFLSYPLSSGCRLVLGSEMTHFSTRGEGCFHTHGIHVCLGRTSKFVPRVDTQRTLSN